MYEEGYRKRKMRYRSTMAMVNSMGLSEAYPAVVERYETEGEDGPQRGILKPGRRAPVRFWWAGGGFGADARPLRDRLREPRAPRPLHIVLGEGWKERRPVAVGSREEEDLLNLFRICVASVFLRNEEDSLLAAYRKSPESRNAVLRALGPNKQRNLHLANLLRFLEGQAVRKAQAPFPYWERRACVYLRLTYSSDGRVTRSEVLGSYDQPSTVDSLLRTTRSWTFPDRAGEGRGGVLACFAMDRREDRLAAAGQVNPDRLSSAIRDLLDRGDLAGWTRIWRESEPGFTLRDFVCAPEPQIRREGPRGTLADLVSALLDKAAGSGEPAHSLRARLHDPRRFRDQIATWPLRHTGELVDRVAWIDSRTVVLVGWSEVQHPRFRNGAWAYIRVPTVWVGDAGTRAVKRYQGAPVDPRSLSGIREKLGELWAALGR
jgi:hypothetical protein